MSELQAEAVLSQDCINIPVSSFSVSVRKIEGERGAYHMSELQRQRTAMDYSSVYDDILDNIPSWSSSSWSSSSSFSSTLFHPKSKSTSATDL